MKWVWDSAPPRSHLAIARAMAAGASGLGAAILALWGFDMSGIHAILPGYFTMKANLALGVLLGGLAVLAMLVPGPSRAWRRIGTGLALAVVAIGAATLAQDLAGVEFGIDQLLVADHSSAAHTGSPGRMSPLAATSLVLAGTAILLARVRSPLTIASAMPVAQGLAAIVAVIAETALVGYVYDVAVLYQVPHFTALALDGAAAELLIGVAILAGTSDRGFMAAFTAPTVSGRIWRRFMPAAIAVPVVLGGLKMLGYRLGLFDPATGTALVAVSTTLIFSAIIAALAIPPMRAELQLHRRMSTTLACIGDAVISTDASGRVQFLNAVAADLTGWTVAEAAGRPLGEVFHIVNETSRQPVESPVDKVMRTGCVAGLANHTTLISREGRETPIDDSAAPIRATDADAGSIEGVVLVFRDVTERREAERQLESRVTERTAQLRALTAEMIHTERNERRRVSQLLHDDLQQLMAAAKLRVGRLAHRAEDEKSRALAGEIDTILADSIAAARSLSSQLSPPVLDSKGLGPALDWLAQQIERDHGLRVRVDLDASLMAATIAGEVGDMVFQAARELLFNVVKHAKSPWAMLSAGVAADGMLGLAVTDFGKGCAEPPVSADSERPGFGLASIRQRVEFLGGRYAIESAPGDGFRVELAVPPTPAP